MALMDLDREPCFGKEPQKNRFLVVSLNPTYQVVVGYGRLNEGHVNRTDMWRNGFSGKGFNVARKLAELGAQAVLLTHMNPSLIDECRAEAKGLGFDVCCVSDPSPIRTCVTLLQNRRRGASKEQTNLPFDVSESMTTTELVENTPPIEGADTKRKVMDSYETLLSQADCVIITGTRSPGYDSNIYASMTAKARQAGKYIILDIKGQDLVRCLSNDEKSMPNLIKPNMEEFLQTFGFDGDPVSILERLKCNAVITNGSKGCFVYDPKSREGLVHIGAIRVKSRNTTGCGDAFTAGLAYSIMQGDDLIAACHAGSRTGAQKAQEVPF